MQTDPSSSDPSLDHEKTRRKLMEISDPTPEKPSFEYEKVEKQLREILINQMSVMGPYEGREAYYDPLFSKEAIDRFWSKFFYHSSLGLVESKFEIYELVGDKLLGGVFSEYLYNRFGDQLTPKIASDIDSSFMNATFQKDLTLKYGLDKLMITHPDKDVSAKKYLGDVFEAFTACLYLTCKEMISEQLGYMTISLMISNIFSSIDIDVNANWKNKLQILKELHDQMVWSRPEFITGSAKISGAVVMQVVYVTQDGTERAIIGYGDEEKEARESAAEQALQYYAEIGLTTESGNQKRSEEIEVGRRKLWSVINEYNKVAKIHDVPTIKDFHSSSEARIPLTTKGGNVLFIYALSFNYIEGYDGKTVVGRLFEKAVGKTPNEAHIKLLEKASQRLQNIIISALEGK